MAYCPPVAHPTPFSVRLRHSLTSLLARNKTQPVLPAELASLPDHLLVDIGIDPRDVPNPAGTGAADPDLARYGIPTSLLRAIPRS